MKQRKHELLHWHWGPSITVHLAPRSSSSSPALRFLSHSQTVLPGSEPMQPTSCLHGFPSLFCLMGNRQPGNACHSHFHLLLRINVLTAPGMVTPLVTALYCSLNTVPLFPGFFSSTVFTLLTFLPLRLPTSLGTPQGLGIH